jgi:hypothetical protein
MLITIENNGIEAQISIPFHVSDIKFGDFCDFREKEAKYFELVKVDKESSAAIVLIGEAVKCLVQGDISELKFSDDMPFAPENYTIGLSDELTILRLYFHIVTVVNSYAPIEVPKTFEIEGEVFHLHYETILKSKNELTTGEAIEVMEFQSQAAQRKVGAVDEDANINFTLGLHEMAILLRKEGEKLPEQKREREIFLKERIVLFQDVPLNVILDVRFFFLNALGDFQKMQRLPIFGSRHSRKSPRVKRLEKPITKQESTPKSFRAHWVGDYITKQGAN